MNTEQISEHAKAAARRHPRWEQMYPADRRNLEDIIQSAITAATAELQSHKDRVQKVMPKIAGLFGIEHPIQLIAAAENDQEDYFDILVKLGGRRIADLEQRLADDAETFAILAGERDELKRHVADLERQLTEARREKYTLEQQLEDAKTDLEAESAKLREQLEEATSLVVQKNRQLGECAESAQVIRQWLTEATAERDQLREQLAEATMERDEMQSDKSVARNILWHLKNKWEARIEKLENRTLRTTCDEDKAMGIQECLDDISEIISNRNGGIS